MRRARTFYFTGYSKSLWLRGLNATVIVFCFRMVLYWYIESQQSHMRFFLIHGRHLSGCIQSSLRAKSDVDNHEIRQPLLSWQTSIGPCLNYPPGHVQREQPWDQATPSMRYCMSSDYTAICWGTWALEVHHFDNNGFRSRETVNIKYCINNSGIWGPTRHLHLKKKTNFLAILRLRKPLKTSTWLAGHGIWTRDLPNTSLIRYHGATSLGCGRFCIRWLFFKTKKQ